MAPLLAVLDQYQAALNARNADCLASCHSDRFMHMTRRDDGWGHRWRRNDREFREGLKRALECYALYGATAFELADVMEITPQPAHSLGRVTWRVLRGDGSELVTLDVTYMVRVRHDEAKVVALADHGELERLAERGVWTRGCNLLFSLPQEREEQRQRASVSGRVAISELFEALERRRASG